MSSCSQEDELVKKLKSACRGDLRTPVLFVASLLRSGERPKKVEGSSVGGDSLPGGKYKRFRSVLKSLKRLLRKCAEFSNIYFALEIPSSYSYWSWPELHAFISSSKVRKAKVADHVDATDRLVGRRIVLSIMSDVECLEASFLIFAKRKSECSLFQYIDITWRSFADHVRSLVHAHARMGRVTRDTVHGKVIGITVPIMGHRKSPNP